MLLCDQLEQQTEASIDAHATLVEVLLAMLTDSVDADELAQNWARIAEHFDSLFTTEQSIEALKQTVLQLAVMGKLVPQNPDDEPASVLLEKIAEEKEQLIKDKKIKKEKPLAAVTDDEKMFELPAGWIWLRLNDFAEVKGGKRLPKGHSFSNKKTDYVYLRVTDMKNGNIDTSDLKYLTKSTRELISNYTISQSDLYITIAGTIGAVGQIPKYLNGANLTENAAKIVFNQVDKSWLQGCLSSRFSQNQFNEKVNQMAQPKLALHRILSTAIALPPKKEQRRIVAKVDELMAICDQLKVKLQQSQETQVKLTDALIERALG